MNYLNLLTSRPCRSATKRTVPACTRQASHLPHTAEIPKGQGFTGPETDQVAYAACLIHSKSCISLQLQTAGLQDLAAQTCLGSWPFHLAQ